MTEHGAWKINGFLALLLLIGLIGGAVYFFVATKFVLGGVLIFLALVVSAGIIIVQPNQSKVITFFGRYIGCVKDAGFWFIIPFSLHKKVSLRVRNFNSKTLKVNDVDGNPIEIAAVVVFKVIDSAKAIFDVDDYEKFVEIQSETALRHVATRYPYDTFKDINQ
jgi:regulator of protease activity HflC (stomatin/prohibitin superfamily)